MRTQEAERKFPFVRSGRLVVAGAYGYSLPLLRARHVALLLLLFRMPRRATEKVRCPMVFPASLPSGDNEGALSAFLPNGAAPDTVLRRCGIESSASSSCVVRPNNQPPTNNQPTNNQNEEEERRGVSHRRKPVDLKVGRRTSLSGLSGSASEYSHTRMVPSSPAE